MTDLAIIRTDNGRYYVSIHGGTTMMGDEELQELHGHISAVLAGADESCGKWYIERRESNRRQRLVKPKVDLSGLTSALGITGPKLRRI